MRTPWKLAYRHLLDHWLRSALTAGGMTVALFLFVFLLTIVTTLEAAVKQSAGNRLVVQSAVSLFVDLPRDYQAKIEAVPGVREVTKLQWFGGIYQDPANFFAQFGVDRENFFDVYGREIGILEGPRGAGPAARAETIEAFQQDRRATVIGSGLAADFGWKVGDTVPLLGTIFQLTDGSAWEFNVVGIYEPLKSNVDDRTLWFRFDYLEEMLDQGLATGPQGVGVFMLLTDDGADSAAVIQGVDGLFENGPQATMTTTEAVFQASFVSMLGNLPLFVGTIGGAVVFAVFFSLVNTMLMSGRQRVGEAGILKALGFPNGALARVLILESVWLSLSGAVLGIALALAAEKPLRGFLGSRFPNYDIAPTTILLGLLAAAALGLVAGLVPAFVVARMRPTEALRSEG